MPDCCPTCGASPQYPWGFAASELNGLRFPWQSTSLRTRAVVESFERGRAVPVGEPLPSGARRGILAGLGSDMPDNDLAAWRRFGARFEEARTWRGSDLALVPTAFDKLDPALCRRLIYRGWWLRGAVLAARHPELVPDPTRLAPPSLPRDGR